MSSDWGIHLALAREQLLQARNLAAPTTWVICGDCIMAVDQTTYALHTIGE